MFQQNNFRRNQNRNQNRTRNNHMQRNRPQITCYKCGAKGHKSPDCKMNKTRPICHFCGNKGHIEVNCFKKKRQQNQKQNNPSRGRGTFRGGRRGNFRNQNRGRSRSRSQGRGRGRCRGRRRGRGRGQQGSRKYDNHGILRSASNYRTRAGSFLADTQNNDQNRRVTFPEQEPWNPMRNALAENQGRRQRPY